jgi:enoyl-[acyl-carrier protein] reductase III
MLVPLRGSWSLVLGVSGGLGSAIARGLAAEGSNIAGVHFDRTAGREYAGKLADELRETGVEAAFANLNIALPSTRDQVMELLAGLTGGSGIRVLVHAVAFGSLVPYLPVDGGSAVSERQLAMTLDVMANSLVYWVQSLRAARLLGRGAKVYALTSAGSIQAMPSYGPVSAAKAALEAHIRQLAAELAPHGIAVNGLRPGTTLTPALEKIPNNAEFAERCRARNPHRRLTEPSDVAEAVVLLSGSDSSWITGNIIGVDGGELIVP